MPTKKTKGRRTPFKCGHKGLGFQCQRCFSANQLEIKANEIAQVIKTKSKKLPDNVTFQGPDKTLLVTAGAHKVEVVTHKLSQEEALGKAVEGLRAHATRLLVVPTRTTSKRFVVSTSDSSL